MRDEALHAFRYDNPHEPVLTLPPSTHGVLSIRAKALLFHDPRSVALLEQIELIAPTDATALIVGETGTGKELVARHIHKRSSRKGPFTAVNCGAFSENLIDAELFGHEAGAFTGAMQARPGWFESANGGTLFLDEIGDLPLSLQVKLLRVLQERQVVRLGARKPIALDVRLVAATNVELLQAVEAQHFRADLYYRLNVAPLTLLPLRERPGDILPLAQHFLRQYGPRLGLADATLSPGAEVALQNYVWPGNIRELENVIHFALVVCRHGVVQATDLRLVAPSPAAVARAAASLPTRAVAEAPAAVAAPAPQEPPPPAVAPRVKLHADLVAALDALVRAREPSLFHAVEEALVRTAFAQSRENQVQTARLLGVTRNTLRTLLKRFGMLSDSHAADDAATVAGIPDTAEASDTHDAADGSDGDAPSTETAALDDGPPLGWHA